MDNEDLSETTERSPLLRDQDERLQQEDDEVDAGDSDEVPLPDEPTTKELIAVMAGIWLGVFFAALDTSIVATLTAPISNEFNSLSLLSWLATGYLISNAACQPLSGKLTDIFGRASGLIFSNVFFGVGCLICGLAQSEWVIIAGRVIAGMGGGGLTAISTFVTSDLVPLRRRGVWQGFGNIVFGLGMGLGGAFGGAVHDWIGWRWAFLMQVPFSIISGILVHIFVKVPIKSSSKSALRRIDFLGAFLLVTCLVLLLLGLNSGGNIFPWTHPFILVILPCAFLAFALFIYVESYLTPEPIIPVQLVLARTVLSACLTNWLSTMSIFLALYYIPLYLQILGNSALSAGLRLIPSAAAMSAGSLCSGLTMRATGRYYILSVASLSLLVFGSATYVTFDLDTPGWTTFVYPIPSGFGYGAMLTITLVAMLSAVEHKDQAVITSASYAFRSTGSTIGITIAGAVFQNILTMDLRRKFSDEDAIKRIRNSLDAINHLPEGWRKQDVLESYMLAVRGAFVAGLGLAVLAMMTSLLMREHVLHKNLARK